jgi:hypothetical protein
MVVDAWADDIARLAEVEPDEIRVLADVADEQADQANNRCVRKANERWAQWIGNLVASDRGILRRAAKGAAADVDLRFPAGLAEDINKSSITCQKLWGRSRH